MREEWILVQKAHIGQMHSRHNLGQTCTHYHIIQLQIWEGDSLFHRCTQQKAKPYPHSWSCESMKSRGHKASSLPSAPSLPQPIHWFNRVPHGYLYPAQISPWGQTDVMDSMFPKPNLRSSPNLIMSRCFPLHECHQHPKRSPSRHLGII